MGVEIERGKLVRKGLYLLVLGCLLFLVSGCKADRLTCEKRVTDTEEVKIDQRLSLVFDKRELKEGTVALSYYYATNPKANAEVMRKDLEDQYAIYKDKKGIEYYFKNLEKGLYFELQAQIKDLSEEDKSNLEIIANYTDMTTAKSDLISEGYQCK